MKKSIRAFQLVSTVFAIAALSACGGGDDAGTPAAASAASTPAVPAPASSTPAASTPPAAQVACRPAGDFTYSGSASQIAANDGQLAVLVVPSLPKAYSKGRNMTAPNAPASSQVQQPSGAFTTLASSAAASDCLGMDHGVVSEIQGVGTDVAIGRWNQAMDTDENTYTMEQGVHYAVGTPLALSATSGTLACTQLIADAVADGDGGVAGTLDASSATLNPGAGTLDNLSLSIRVRDTPYTFTSTQTPLNGAATSGQLLVQSVVVGHDATQPLIAVGYSATLPNTQGIGGVVVLACK
ncbi:Putative lipoprotein transmembrane [Burkholderia plantarii]|nr:Putative lipoprotein transmembrane [Burkholderia plantarii]